MASPRKRLFSRPASVVPKQRRVHFLAAWIRSPLKVGSLMPSSRALAMAMARQVDLSVPGTVIELGAGTGVVTHALLARGVPAERLLVVERDPRLYAIMKQHYPHLHVVRADALELHKLLDQMQISDVAAVVSSLPLLSMPQATRLAIEQQMAKAITGAGRIIQFTYGLNSPFAHDRLRGLRLFGKRAAMIVKNVPPAHIWVYQRDRRIKRR